MTFPPLARVRQSIPQPRVADVPGTVRRLILESRLRERVPAGGTIAVGVGSRGITAIPTRRPGGRRRRSRRWATGRSSSPRWGATAARPPRASASCWPATASRPRRWASPVTTDMDTVVLGTNPVGLPIYFDKNAYEADGIVLLNRVKPHTDFHATHESGVLKMLVDRPGQARRGQPGPQARPPGPARGPAGRRPVPGREHRFALGPGDRRERRGPARRDRRRSSPRRSSTSSPGCSTAPAA